MANYSFKEPPPAENGATIEGHNLLRGAPHTKIYEGMTGLTFRNCNLTNCDLPADATVENCLNCHVSFCSHLHESWSERGFIGQCSQDCEHLSQIDTVSIDGVAVDQTYHYADKVVLQ
jgi:hypothetical protein